MPASASNPLLSLDLHGTVQLTLATFGILGLLEQLPWNGSAAVTVHGRISDHD
jgi:hypothetical protein